MAFCEACAEERGVASVQVRGERCEDSDPKHGPCGNVCCIDCGEWVWSKDTFFGSCRECSPEEVIARFVEAGPIPRRD